MTIFRNLLVLAICILSAGCDSAGDQALTCALSVGPATMPSSARVTLSAEREGDGAVSSLTFTGSDGNETISNPSLPWTESFDAPANTPISMSAQGEIEAGTLRIKIHMEEAQSGATFSVEEKDECSQG